MTHSGVTAVDENGAIVGLCQSPHAFFAFVLLPFAACQGDTLPVGQTARATGNLTQSIGTTTICGTYEMLGGAGNDTYVLANGGTLQGNGTLVGNLTNVGGVFLPGGFTIAGNYVQSATGVMTLEVSDQTLSRPLSIRGDATLGGTLNLAFGLDLSPPLPSSFPILVCSGTLSCFFEQVEIVGALPQGAKGYALLVSPATGAGGMQLILTLF
jgi:hypothetical protein